MNLILAHRKSIRFGGVGPGIRPAAVVASV